VSSYRIETARAKGSNCGSCPRLAGAGGVVLQRPDALGQGCRALMNAALPVAPLAGRAACAGSPFRCQHGSIGEFGPSSCIASFATSAAISLMRSPQQCIFHALGRQRFRLLLDRVDVALAAWRVVAGNAKAVPRPPPSRSALFERRDLPTLNGGDFAAQFLGVRSAASSLAQLVVFKVALGQQLAWGRRRVPDR